MGNSTSTHKISAQDKSVPSYPNANFPAELIAQGRPGHEEPARQATPIPTAHHSTHRPRKGDSKGDAGQGR